MKKFSFLFLFMLSSMMGMAQSWNFMTASDDDIALMNGDNTNWYHESSSSNNRYHTITAIEAAPLKAGNTELEYAKGLLFTIPANTSTNGNLRIDIKNKRLWVAGTSCSIVIPNVEAGKEIKVIAKSSSTSAARGINVSENVTPTSGKFNETSTDQVTNVGTVKTAGDITLTFTGAMYIYEMSVSDPDDDDESGEDTPVVRDDDYSTSANGMKNQMVLTVGNSKRFYNTESIENVTIADEKVTVKQAAGSYTFNNNVSEIQFAKASTESEGQIDNTDGKVTITEARGWFESAYVKFTPFADAKTYNVYIKGGSYNDYTKIDNELVRKYEDYGRADVLGLVAGDGYSIKVVPVDANGEEMPSAANEATGIKVTAYDRSGFAHKGRTEGIGAYNNDGSLKANANVVYITKDNAKTVSLDIATNSKGVTAKYTGFQQLIYGYQKGDANGSYEKKPLCIRIIGTISASDCDEFLSSAEGIQIKGAKVAMPMNITIEGVGDDATTTGFGFLIRNAGSIELRNFANMLCMDDAVSIDTDNSNIWVHNLDLFYGNTGGDADQAKGDGTVDMKGDSKYITVSYNHLWDSGKASLCGMKSESGPNWITYHHNWFDHSDSRHPRIRTMSVHVWNNYYDGNSKYGVGAAYKSNAFVEANYFRNCKYPMLISLQGSDIATNPKGTFSGEDGGMIKSFNNIITGALGYVTYQKSSVEFDAYEVSTRNEQVPAAVKAKVGGRVYANWDINPDIMYDYTPDAPADVPSIVTGWLGAGRMGHGDFQWTFDNATEDNNYNVIPGLKTALQNYKSKLIGIYGETSDEGGEGGGDEGGEGGGDEPTPTPTPEPTPEGSILASFDGAPSTNIFSVGSTSAYGDGKITYNEVYYKKGVKLDSKGSITFTPQKDYNMTIVMSVAKDGRDVKLNNVTTTVSGTLNTSGNYYELEPIAITSGTEYVITKGSKEGMLMLIKLEPVSQ